MWGRRASVRAAFVGDVTLETALTYLNDNGRYDHQITLSPPLPDRQPDEPTEEESQEQ